MKRNVKKLDGAASGRMCEMLCRHIDACEWQNNKCELLGPKR